MELVLKSTPELVDLEKSDFDWFRELIERESGIHIRENKYMFMYNRLLRRIRNLGMDNFSQYKDYLRTGEGFEKELGKLLEEIVIPESSFFRYQPQFEMLVSMILPDLMKRRIMQGKPLNVVSFGCATGEEPYSIALLLYDRLSVSQRQLVRIRAVDLSETLLSKAREGLYEESDLANVPPIFLSQYFIRENGGYRLISRVSQMVHFYKFNLVHENWTRFNFSDLAFCRNTTIYFNKEARHQVNYNLKNCLRENGYLVLGHTEIINGDQNGLKHMGNMVYRKVNP